MKINWNKKYTTIAIYSLIVLAAAVLFVVFVFRFDSFTAGFSWIGDVAAPIICGIIIAYILNPLMMLIENKVFGRIKFSKPKEPLINKTSLGEKEVVKKIEKKIASPEKKMRRRRALARILSIALTYIILFAVLVGIAIAVVPSVAKSVVDLAEQLPEYLKQAEEFVNNFFKDNPQISNFIFEEFSGIAGEIKKWAADLKPIAGDIFGNVGSGLLNFVISVLVALKNVLLGLIIAIYLLYSKERLLAQCKKIFFAFMKNSRCEHLFGGLHKANDIFKKYIISNLLDAMIIFAFMMIGMSAMGMPYQMLISAICAVTNLIPFFGPFIGAIPCAVLILLVDPSKVIWFALFVLILQQCDGNIIKPFLFGETMGLPAIWVLVSIIVGGGIFGIPGMLLGAPVFAVIYLMFAEFVRGKLKKKSLPDATDIYMQDVEDFSSKYINAPPGEPIEDFKLDETAAPISLKPDYTPDLDGPSQSEEILAKAAPKPARTGGSRSRKRRKRK